MGKTKKCCMHCHQSFHCYRNPQQQYCAQKACQNARKNDWRKLKRSKDEDYRENQRRANETWRKQRSDYWQRYRNSHPAYTQHNRERQKIRDKKRSESAQAAKASHLAKSDASAMEIQIKSGTYCMIPVTRPFLAKSDALIVELAVITGFSAELHYHA